MHGVTFTCSNVYTQSATVLNKTSFIVLFQNQVLPEIRLVDYRDLRGLKVSVEQMPDVAKSNLPKEGPFFNLVQTFANFGEQNLNSVNRRYVDAIYKETKPIFSATQAFVCLKREREGIIDVYRCDEVDSEFFKTSDVLTIGSPEYVFSVESLDEDSAVEFSADDNYMAVVSDKSLDVFDIRIK